MLTEKYTNLDDTKAYGYKEHPLHKHFRNAGYHLSYSNHDADGNHTHQYIKGQQPSSIEPSSKDYHSIITHHNDNPKTMKSSWRHIEKLKGHLHGRDPYKDISGTGHASLKDHLKSDSDYRSEETDPLIAATLGYIDQQIANAGGSLQTLTEGDAEHEKYKDHTKNPYHQILTQHGFVHKSTEHKKNRFAANNPKADYTEHRYEHPGHGKSHVLITQDHSKGGGGYSFSDDKGHSFIHRHEQSNGIMSPSTGNSKNQLHRSLSYHYGIPKGVKPPPLTAAEKKYSHLKPEYKQNE
jgi:hypothetical protein